VIGIFSLQGQLAATPLGNQLKRLADFLILIIAMTAHAMARDKER
jgi:hypothetical protein